MDLGLWLLHLDLNGLPIPFNGLHSVEAILEFGLVDRDSDFVPEDLPDFAQVFVFAEELLVVAPALGGSSGPNKGGQLVVKLHLSA